MNFKEYQNKSRRTAIYKDAGKNYLYPTLGLVGEAGEVANKLKKVMRGDTPLTAEVKKAVGDELGDVLWYMAQLATELNLSFDQIAAQNIKKLYSRLDRGKLHGSGDNR